MIPFDFQLRTRIVFGLDQIDRLGELASEMGARRALVVSDQGIIDAGHTRHGINALEQAGIDTFLFDEVHENPTTDEVELGVKMARRYDPELIVGLGGGSSMDCAKGINFLFSNGGSMRDYWGVGKALHEMLPMIAVPTTAGTGSEAQSFALISDSKTHVKMACGDKKASFRVAILDPKLTITQPQRITAVTGIDAIAHAVETYVTKPQNAISRIYSREAWRLLALNFPRVLDDPNNLEGRGAMQLGACLAGLAIENSMLGATHALANPLTATYGIVHGQAIGIMLPHVVRFNATRVAPHYQEMGEVLAEANGSGPAEYDADGISEFLRDLVAKADLPGRLSDCDVKRDRLPELAEAATRQWTAKFNPREATRDDFLTIYEQAF